MHAAGAGCRPAPRTSRDGEATGTTPNETGKGELRQGETTKTYGLHGRLGIGIQSEEERPMNLIGEALFHFHAIRRDSIPRRSTVAASQGTG